MARTMNKLGVRLTPWLVILALAACSTAPVKEGEPIAPMFPPDRVLAEGVTYAADVYDPWEGFNRTMYRFNYRFDKYVFLPAVRAYQTVTPDLAEQGVHNFFNNFRDVITFLNNLLQASPGKALQTAGRVAANMTFGMFGFIDVATTMGLPRYQEDFGQTMGRWGMGSGPYLVLPIVGPSSLRDGVGLGVDWYAGSAIRDWALDPETWQEWTWTGLNAIDTRAHVPFRYYETGSAFEYDMVRWLYTTKRRVEIAK